MQLHNVNVNVQGEANAPSLSKHQVSTPIESLKGGGARFSIQAFRELSHAAVGDIGPWLNNGSLEKETPVTRLIVIHTTKLYPHVCDSSRLRSFSR